jgi:hypothetical protein
MVIMTERKRKPEGDKIEGEEVHLGGGRVGGEEIKDRSIKND